MALVKQSEHQFKRNPEIDEKLNQFIKDSEKLVAYVKELPREELERKYLLAKMNEQNRRESYGEKVREFINKPENTELKKSLVTKINSQKNSTLIQEAKRELYKQGIKMSM